MLARERVVALWALLLKNVKKYRPLGQRIYGLENIKSSPWRQEEAASCNRTWNLREDSLEKEE